MAKLAIYLESMPKRTFACALDWPGWSRAGKTADAAIEALLAAAGRYRSVADRAGQSLAIPRGIDGFEVVERIEGNAGTEFGVPSNQPTADLQPLDDVGLERQLALLEAAWATFDDAADAAEGLELRKGPRGGGRELEKIRGHVLEAEEAYLRQLGRRPPKETRDRPRDHLRAIRTATLETLDAILHGRVIPDRANVKQPWPPRYHVRRSAWHALDHAWEIEDRAIRA